MIPVWVLTGFLGSGKTTLLARLLRHPDMGRTAVVMNELGAVGLDHDLIETSDEDLVRLSNGCLCCTARSDLGLTLGELAVRRQAGAVPPFERVVIETTGLADPAPMLHALLTDTVLADSYELAGVVTTVDAVLGVSTLDRYPESVRQVAVADRVVLTKTDVRGVATGTLQARLASINPAAPVLDTSRDEVTPSHLFDTGAYAPAATPDAVARWLGDDAVAAVHRAGELHRPDIDAVCVVRDRPLHAATLPLLLAALAENCGAGLLRAKGIVGVREDPQRPMVIHGVQHVYHSPVWLDRWPSDDRRTRIVLIGNGIPAQWLHHLVDLLDAEVDDEISRL